MIIGFTGSQSGMTHFQKEELKKILQMKECSEFIMGDCIGSDKQAANIAVECGVTIFTVYPPVDIRKRAFFADERKNTAYNQIITPYVERLVLGKPIKIRWMPIKPYLERNKDIVDASAIMIATPKEHKHTIRSGTWSTIRYAWKVKKTDIVIIPPIVREDNVENVPA
jgi:hypothetical protein